MIDLQDCGMRHFTYISTLYTILKSAAEYHKKVVVLDRPNPLGDIMEGPLVEPQLHSFISIAAIPVRHGMTIGELARYFNMYELESPADLNVICMKDYDRTCGLGGKFLAPLSPNIPSSQACYGYSFLGMLGEFKPFNVGIAFNKPFQMIMLPAAITWTDAQWHSLAHILKGYGINASLCHRDAKSGASYRGLQIHIPDITSVPSFQVLLAILDCTRTAGLKVTFSELGEKAIGTTKLRQYLDDNLERAQLTASINDDLRGFYKKAQPCFLYKPWPRAIAIDKKAENQTK